MNQSSYESLAINHYPNNAQCLMYVYIRHQNNAINNIQSKMYPSTTQILKKI